MLHTILFDLDGTLLPMDLDTYIHGYFKELSLRMEPLGYSTDKLISSIWEGTKCMVKNDGTRTNEEVFWEKFQEIWGQQTSESKALLDDFYYNEFDKVQSYCGYNPEVPLLINDLKNKGINLVLATNPLFPSIATEKRLRWAGLDPSNFSYITVFSNSGHSKPNPEYYQDLIKRLPCTPEQILMVGNDVDEDMVAGSCGCQVFLLTDCLINKHNQDISKYPHGNIQALRAYIEELL